uniref:Uncharacterized protein n=1 Tax=Ochrobactrum phage ORM_20 TaxID=2985243 RepID=A0A9N6WTV4_9VIRU|nr:hypothetical protein ORM20_00234 [Ochrobactrum phage ORM_20]
MFNFIHDTDHPVVEIIGFIATFGVFFGLAFIF